MVDTLRTLGWVIWLFAYMIGRLPRYWRALWLAKKGRTEERDALVQAEVARWAPRLLRHIKTTVVMRGGENLPTMDRPALIACNHQSFIDIPVLLGALKPPRPLMARRGIFKVPLLAGWMRQLGCVVVDRDDARAAVAALLAAQAVLEGGRSLVIFPEGTRAKDGVLGKFQPGAVRIACKAGVPIVPVMIDGTHNVLENNSYKVKPATVALTVLPPVETAGLTREAQRALPEQLRGAIAAAQAEARREARG